MSNFRIAALVAGLGFALWLAPMPAQAQTHDAQGMQMNGAQASEVHLMGEVIDVTCYARMDTKGDDHAKCGAYCVKQGGPLGVLDEKSGQIYLVLPAKMGGDPKVEVLDFMGKRVEVTGKVQTKGGLKTLTVASISEAKG